MGCLFITRSWLFLIRMPGLVKDVIFFLQIITTHLDNAENACCGADHPDQLKRIANKIDQKRGGDDLHHHQERYDSTQQEQDRSNPNQSLRIGWQLQGFRIFLWQFHVL